MHTTLCLLFLSTLLFGQDTIKVDEEKKCELAIKAGGYYKYFLGKRYIDPAPYDPFNFYDFPSHQYEGFTKMPAFNFTGGVSLTCKIYKNCYLTSGLTYFIRRDIYESSFDTVVKYNVSPYPSKYNDIHNAIKYDYSHTNIELSLLARYKIGKWNLSGGVNFPVWSYYKASYTYLVPPFSSTAPTAQKTFTEVTTPFPSVFFPALQASYDLRIKKVPLSPFIGIDFGKMKSFYLQGGVIIPLLTSARKT